MSDHIDHSVVITRDYAAAWTRFTELGFTLSPESRHQVTATAGGPLVASCTANRNAYFGDSFVELIGIVDETAPDPWRVLPLLDPARGGYQGVRGASFDFGDSEQALARLSAAGLAGSGVLSLQRPVDTPDGPRTVRARSVHFDRARTPEGIVHTAEHLTREYVHQERYLTHANGARYLAGVLLVVPDGELPAYRDRYAAMLGRPGSGDGPRWVFGLGDGRFELLAAAALAEELPGEVAPALPYFAAQAVAVADLGRAREVIHAAGIGTVDRPDGFFVRATDAAGSALDFRTAQR